MVFQFTSVMKLTTLLVVVLIVKVSPSIARKRHHGNYWNPPDLQRVELESSMQSHLNDHPSYVYREPCEPSGLLKKALLKLGVVIPVIIAYFQIASIFFISCSASTVTSSVTTDVTQQVTTTVTDLSTVISTTISPSLQTTTLSVTVFSTTTAAFSSSSSSFNGNGKRRRGMADHLLEGKRSLQCVSIRLHFSLFRFLDRK
jgi:hypothetical protein